MCIDPLKTILIGRSSTMCIGPTDTMFSTMLIGLPNTIFNGQSSVICIGPHTRITKCIGPTSTMFIGSSSRIFIGPVFKLF